jgi:hypothetical protein
LTCKLADFTVGVASNQSLRPTTYPKLLLHPFDLLVELLLAIRVQGQVVKSAGHRRADRVEPSSEEGDALGDEDLVGEDPLGRGILSRPLFFGLSLFQQYVKEVTTFLRVSMIISHRTEYCCPRFPTYCNRCMGDT